jgi:hypothetical protein
MIKPCLFAVIPNEILRRIAPGWWIWNARASVAQGFIRCPKGVPRCQSASASYMTWDEFDISTRILRWVCECSTTSSELNFLSTMLTEAN